MMPERPPKAIYPTLHEITLAWRNCLASSRPEALLDKPAARFMTQRATRALSVLADGSAMARGRLLVEVRLELRAMRNGGLECSLVDHLPYSWRQRATQADAALAHAIDRRWLRRHPQYERRASVAV